jgi:hypothetical protein
LLIAALLGAGLAQSDYFPSREGMSWTYSSGETQILSGPRDLGGVPVMVLTHYFDGVPISEDYLVYGQDVRSVGTASGGQLLDYVPALQVYAPQPLQPGMLWQSTTEVAGLSITLASEVLAVRGVQTPAGRFNALHIQQRTLTNSGASTTLDLFFVPSVGVVRYITQDGTVVDLIEKNF